jgi:pyruvate carboxylase
LLVKVIASAHAWDLACHRMDRALREFRIAVVKTNIPFLENVINNPISERAATTTLVDNTPELYAFTPRRDRATKLLNFLGNVIVNGNPHAKGIGRARFLRLPGAAYDPQAVAAQGHTRLPAGTRAQEVRGMGEQTEALLITDTTFRDAHQSLMATRVRTYDMLACAAPLAHRLGAVDGGLFSLEMWGGATFDTAMRFLQRGSVGAAAAASGSHPEHLLPNAFPRLKRCWLFQLSRQRGHGFVQHAAASGMDIFRIFDSLNYLPNMRVAMEAVQKTTHLRSGDLLHRGHPRSERRDKYSLKYYVRMAKELERMGAHFLAIKDMAGLCRPSRRASWSRL